MIRKTKRFFIPVVMLSIIGEQSVSGADLGVGVDSLRERRAPGLAIVRGPTGESSGDESVRTRAICQQLRDADTAVPLASPSEETTPLQQPRTTNVFSALSTTEGGWRIRFEDVFSRQIETLIIKRDKAELQQGRYKLAGRIVKLVGGIIGIGVATINSIDSIKDKEGSHIVTSILVGVSSSLLLVVEFLQIQADSFNTTREQANKELEELYQDGAQDIAKKSSVTEVENVKRLRSAVAGHFDRPHALS